MIELDGSHGEGGGQILRTALALSMCTGVPMRISNIRAKRAKPGLMRQHLACVHAAQQVSCAEVSGAELGSQALEFVPGPVRAGDYRFAIGTAGSCTLVLQTVLPPLMLANAPSTLHLSGGTHNPMAPPYHFLERSFAPLVQRCGAGLELNIRRHGFYPAGGGEVEATILPAPGGLQPFDLMERGALRAAYAEALIPALPRGVAMRELQALGQALGWSQEQLQVPPVRQNEGPGNALLATLVYEHVTEVFTSFGEKGVSAEQVAAALAREVKGYQEASDGVVGPHLADQLALPLALAVNATGRPARYSFSQMTEHTRTNFGVVERFLPVAFETERGERQLVVEVRKRPV
ncbi:RNA 3'-terminal phosphate cyclase [Schlegelella sp. S2-27]|uniref:RNA 3'-terminal phosphate cyclase n=1 Tax=Caldimonas mangrovi TaxID=2944811 RepID=A0ABT0YPH3_9BURK|nr:RNA 3'-terminal phosphate cyclase [Caldimonas mangrovi]MCM5680640.1 RNA 3'-terminal phosphate cyclase [Caldimonas mangrovi]